MRDFLIAILVAAGAVMALPSTSATQTSGRTIIMAAPVDDAKAQAIREESLIEQSLSKGFAVIYSFVWRGENACDRMTNSTFRWCLTTP
jgi:hypothetical protein